MLPIVIGHFCALHYIDIFTQVPIVCAKLKFLKNGSNIRLVHWVSKEPQRSPEAPIKYLEGTLISLVHTVPQDYLLTRKIESFIFSCLFTSNYKFIFRHQKYSEDFEFLLAQNQDLLVFCNLRS